VFLIGAINQIWLQDHRMDTFRPVQAIVQSARVIEKQRTSKGRRYTDYSPAVRYSYEVAGRQYSSTGIFPLSTGSGTHQWASEIIDRFKAGTQCTAWYDPTMPGDAFIIRRCRFTPPAVVLFVMPFLGIFTLGLGYGVLSDLSSRAPIDLGDGRFELHPQTTLASEGRSAAVISAIWYLVAILAIGDYSIRAGQPPPSDLGIAPGRASP